MKIRYFIFLLFLLLNQTVYGQDGEKILKGKVSYVSSNSIYVSFQTTEGINSGDTLFRISEKRRIPILVVINKSSISCVTRTISTSQNIRIGEEFVVVIRDRLPEPLREDAVTIEAPVGQHADTVLKEDPVSQPSKSDRKDIRGHVSVSSYNILSEQKTLNRMRYVLSMQGDHINGGRVSFDNYIVFRNVWGESAALSEQLKIYSLFLKYDINPSTTISLGRKIHPELSNVGAIDGVILQKEMGKMSVGAMVGSRPDFEDYSFDPSLFQFGAYATFATRSSLGSQKSTLAIIEQTNHFNTDRRFAYLQNHGTLLKNLYWMGTAELSLFENVNENPINKVQLTNTYLLVRYRLSRKLSISAAYDSRQNVIYYETYKNFIDQLIERETRQGLRFHLTYRPVNLVSINLNGGWRFQESGSNDSKNINGIISLNNIPGLDLHMSLNASYLLTPYIESTIAGLRVYKNLFHDRVTTDVYYRWVYYDYRQFDIPSQQNIGGINLTLNLPARSSIQFYYEGIFDSSNEIYHQLNMRISKKFRQN